ncbi:MAG: response regulator [Solirubrobacterales bacterium]|nr:response regulator [Solirubrobacterales bacterium]
MAHPGPEHLDQRVLLLTPTGRDAELACQVLTREGFGCEICEDVAALGARVEAGAGVALVAKEALLASTAEPLVAALGRQEPWSDLPLIVLTGGGETNPAGLRLLETIRPLGNVTLIERPLRIMTLVSAVRAALAARRRQYQVRDLLRELNEAVRRRDEYLAMLGHELRNPLAAIGNATALLSPSALPDEQTREARAIIDRQSRHLGRLVDDLLTITRINSGHLDLQRQPVDLVEVARRCLRALDEDGRGHQHQLILSVDPQPVVVAGDGIRLEQILTNLLANALKFTPPGGRIDLSVHRQGESAEVCVRDTGRGIAPEMLESIFEPFAQVRDSLARAPGGFGIGLTLVRSLVTLHGGTIGARSAGLGRGSEFVVRLPLGVDARPTAPSQTSPACAPELESSSARHHILIIEDHSDNRRTLGALLRSWGHRVELAEDGKLGVELAIAHDPKIAIIDIGLPGLDGYEVARRIRAATGDRIFLIALTGYGQPEDRLRALGSGFDAHLVKPINVDHFEHLLESVGAGKSS